MNQKILSRNAFFCLATAVLYFGILSVQAADNDYEIGTWANFCQGAISHTFDDYAQSGLGQIVDGQGQAAFNEKDFNMTIFVITNTNPNWGKLQAAFAEGHEIGSHTVSHNSSTSAFEQSQKTIQDNVPGEKCVTVAYPNCQQNGASTLSYYIAGRNCDGNVNSKSPGNWEQISSKMFGTCGGCGNTASSMNDFANSAVSSNGWAVTCHHGIGSDSHGWAVTNLDAVKSHLEYLDQNRDKIWCETFGNVARYIHERDAATVTEKSADESSFTIEITDDLDDEIYNYPLTIRRPFPDGWVEDQMEITQNGEAIEAKVVDNFIQFQAVPDGGDVVISSGIVPVRHGIHTNSILPTDVIGFANNRLQISTKAFTGNSITVSIFNLNGKLLANNTISETEGPVANIDLRESLSKSAIIVKATNGTVSYMKRIIQ